MPPRITVLLATLDGAAYLDEQLDSILDQQGAELRVVVSDDGSADGTVELLQRRAAVDARVELLPTVGPSGSSAANFGRLLRDADLSDADYVALADQDDVWHPGKLAGHAALLAERGAEGVSSDVIAFWPDGRRKRVRKAFPQRRFDYVCESPGPGCSILVTPRLAALTAERLADPASAAHRVDYNDWLLYALCRARGWGWHIDAEPTVDYRQHDSNVLGANHGAGAAVQRIRLMTNRWHRTHAVAVVDVALEVAPPAVRDALRPLRDDLTGPGPARRARLAARSRQLRRRPRDQAVLAGLLCAGFW